MELKGKFVVFVFSLLFLISIITALRIPNESENSIEQTNYANEVNAPELEYRPKRQLEKLDEDFPTASSQDAPEESGFWDRVVKVALKLFNKFVEWLNS